MAREIIDVVSSDDEVYFPRTARTPLKTKRTIGTPAKPIAPTDGTCKTTSKAQPINVKGKTPRTMRKEKGKGGRETKEIKDEVKDDHPSRRTVGPLSSLSFLDTIGIKVETESLLLDLEKVGTNRSAPVPEPRPRVLGALVKRSPSPVPPAPADPIDEVISPPREPTRPPIAETSPAPQSVFCTYREATEDDSEEEIGRPLRTPYKGRKTVIIDSDESDSGQPHSSLHTLGLVTKPTPRVVDLTANSDNDAEDLQSRRLPTFDEEEDERERLENAEDGYDVAKHYDDSLGSLRDFIVDDSDSDLSDLVVKDDEDEEESDHVQEVKPKRSKSKPRTDRVITISSDSDDSGSNYHSAQEDEDDILHYSPPRRLITLPELSALTLESPSPPRSKPSRGAQTPSRDAPPKSAKKLKWDVARVQIAQQVFDELDRRVFEKRLSEAGARLEWCNRLLTTAGTASVKKIAGPDGTRKEEARIKLSEKVLTGEEQILSTVAHEMCHLASWIISNERKNPHGRVFKSWGAKVMRARPDIEVTTKHTYRIEYKYQWQCTNAQCRKIYRRHSKSIDLGRHRCGSCQSKLEPLFETKASTPFQRYLKENLAEARQRLAGASHGEVMRALSKRWATAPEATAADHFAYWRSLSSV